jgi:hypothetical protein
VVGTHLYYLRMGRHGPNRTGNGRCSEQRTKHFVSAAVVRLGRALLRPRGVAVAVVVSLVAVCGVESSASAGRVASVSAGRVASAGELPAQP